MSCRPLRFAAAGVFILRKEAAKGGLTIERMAGKDFVTLAAVNAI